MKCHRQAAKDVKNNKKPPGVLTPGGSNHIFIF